MSDWWEETIIAPAPRGLVLTGGVPNVIVTQHKLIQPAAGVLHLTGHAPVNGIVATPAAKQLTLTGGTPIVRIERIIQPAAGIINLTGGTPSLVKNTILAPAAGSIALTGGTPTVAVTSPVAYNVVAAGNTGFGSIGSFNITAASGADVFVVVNWDRSGVTISGVTVGGVTATLVDSLFHNNTSGIGGVSIYRCAGVGNGSARSVAISVSGGGWLIANAISFSSVNAVGTLVKNFGSSTTASQALTIPSGIVLQVISSGNGGAGVADYGSFTGMTNRYHAVGTGSSLAISTATATGTVSASVGVAQPWAAISVPLT